MKEIKNIAVIDDDPITTFGLKKLINLTGYKGPIESYMNGKVAIDGIIEKINNNTSVPDIIFLDINMPILDGWGFLKLFLELGLTQKIRINIVTSSIDPYDKNQWEQYKDNTHHLITFNHKPITRTSIAEITQVA